MLTWKIEDLATPDVVESTVDVSFRVYIPYRLSPPVDGAPVAFVLDAFKAPLPASRFEAKDREPSASVFEIESNFNTPVYENEYCEETFAFARAILHEHALTKVSDRKWSCVVCSGPASTFLHTAFLRRQVLHDDDTLDLDIENTNKDPSICNTCIVVVDVSLPACTNNGEERCYQEGIELSKKYAQRIMMHKDILIERPREIEHDSQKPFNNPSDISQPGMPMFKDCRCCRKSQANFACAACRKVGYVYMFISHMSYPTFTLQHNSYPAFASEPSTKIIMRLYLLKYFHQILFFRMPARTLVCAQAVLPPITRSRPRRSTPLALLAHWRQPASLCSS